MVDPLALDVDDDAETVEVETVGVEAFTTAMNAVVVFVCAIVEAPATGAPCPPEGIIPRVLVLNSPLTAGVGSERKRYPSPLFVLFAVIVRPVEICCPAWKTRVKLPVVLVWLLLSDQTAV